MWFAAWSLTSDWSEYYSTVVSVRRLSGSKWRVEYRERGSYTVHEILVIADCVYVEAY